MVYTQWQLPLKKHLAATPSGSFIVGDPDVSKRTSGTAQGIQLGAKKGGGENRRFMN